MFCTDITNAPFSNAGDWQMQTTFGGDPPDFVSGSWKSATSLLNKTVTPNTLTITTDADPAKNGFNLGPDANPKPSVLTNLGYTAEARWNVNGGTCNGVAFQSGHTY